MILRLRGLACFLAGLSLSFASTPARAEWQRGEHSLAWLSGTQIVWKLSLDPQAGNKMFFHPLAVAGGPTLTVARPEDHPWHYGLWFSWKYINQVNYWEESRETKRPEGITAWQVASLRTRRDGSALIVVDLTYTHPSGRVDLTEMRVLKISAPDAEGGYSIDWRSKFKAGPEGALLDRTAMMGEPEGQVNGGYAGMGLRLASPPLAISFVSNDGPVLDFKSNRARPAAAALAANLRDGAKDLGGIAIFSDPGNSGVEAPWYIVDAPQQQMRFICAAVLAPKPITLAPGGKWKLHYKIAVRRAAWTPEALQTLMTER